MMKATLAILSLFLVASCGCTYSRFSPRCPEWSDAAIVEFNRYRATHRENDMVRAILRDAQVCSALRQEG
jgi:hypothetical protein